MKMSKAVEAVETWLNRNTYGYLIDSVELKAEGEYRFYISEYDPNGEGDTYFFTVNEDGIINDNGENVLEVAKNVYSNDGEDLRWLIQFENDYFAENPIGNEIQGNLSSIEEKDEYIKTNMGTMPIKDYLNIRAIECGFDSYEDLKAHGFSLAIPADTIDLGGIKNE